MNETKFKEANGTVNSVYKALATIKDDTVKRYCGTLDSIMSKLQKNVDSMSDKEIRKAMLDINCELYELSKARDKSSLTSAISIALNKEDYANSLQQAVGKTVEDKKNEAILNSSESNAVSILYSSISDALKFRHEVANKMLSTLTNLLISRASERKFDLSIGTSVEGDEE